MWNQKYIIKSARQGRRKKAEEEEEERIIIIINNDYSNLSISIIEIHYLLFITKNKITQIINKK